MLEHHKYKESKFKIGARIRHVKTGALGTVQSGFTDSAPSYYPDSWVVPVVWDKPRHLYDNKYAHGETCGMNDWMLEEVLVN
jgi:hypothetical protein